MGVRVHTFDAETKDRAAAICPGIRRAHVYFGQKNEFCLTINHLSLIGHDLKGKDLIQKCTLSIYPKPFINSCQLACPVAFDN